MEQLLEIIRRDRDAALTWRAGTMLAVFDLLGSGDELVRRTGVCSRRRCTD